MAPLFKLAFRVPYSDYAGLDKDELYLGKERLTTVAGGLSFHWGVVIDKYWKDLRVGLKLYPAQLYIQVAKLRNLRLRYEGQEEWKKAWAMAFAPAWVMGGWPIKDTIQNFRFEEPEQALLVEFLVEMEAIEGFLPAPRTVPASSHGLVAALMSQVLPFPALLRDGGVGSQARVCRCERRAGWGAWRWPVRTGPPSGPRSPTSPSSATTSLPSPASRRPGGRTS